MKVVVRISTAFQKQAKPLLKKFASLSDELKRLADNLSENPYLGKEIMPSVYKIRLAIKSKGKGKRGGARVISFHQKEAHVIGIFEKNKDEHTVILISIYDKSVTENITDNEIRRLIQNIDFEGYKN